MRGPGVSLHRIPAAVAPPGFPLAPAVPATPEPPEVPVLPGGSGAAATRPVDRTQRVLVASAVLLLVAGLLTGLGAVVGWVSRAREIQANQAVLTRQVNAVWGQRDAAFPETPR